MNKEVGLVDSLNIINTIPLLLLLTLLRVCAFVCVCACTVVHVVCVCRINPGSERGMSSYI